MNQIKSKNLKIEIRKYIKIYNLIGNLIKLEFLKPSYYDNIRILRLEMEPEYVNEQKKSEINNDQRQNIIEQGVIDTPGVSKKQLKKQQKKQKWQEIKKIKRKQDRQKQKIKKKQKKMLQDKQSKTEENPNKFTKRRKDQYQEKMQGNLRVVIDLQFYGLMTQKQQTSLAKQLAYSHSVNRRAQNPFNFIITSVDNTTLKFLSQKYNVDNYGITIREDSIQELFDRQKIVYLTGDAEQTLQQFLPDQVYVIGGIVDHNRLKNITINYANQKKIKAKKLPMDGVKLRASVHLAVNHVWEWMLRKYNGETWKQAIKAVIPDRKLQCFEKQIINEQRNEQ